MEITEEALYRYAPEAEKLWLGALPPDGQIPEHTFSRRFERKMKRLIREQRRSPAMRKYAAMAKKVAAVALIVFAVGFSGLMTVEACRAKLVEVITEVFRDLTQFSFSSSRDPGLELGEIEFSYLPDGVVEIERRMVEGMDEQTIFFEDPDGRLLVFRQILLTNATEVSIILDTEDADVTTVLVHECNATLVVKDGYTALLWEDDTYMWLLSGDFEPEEMLKISDGLKINQ